MNSDILGPENVEGSSDIVGKDEVNSKNPDNNKRNKYIIRYFLIFQILERRKRRSKHIQEGRTYQCECGKAYLSIPALNNHKNSKHNSGAGVQEKRPRGRPRKYVK